MVKLQSYLKPKIIYYQQEDGSVCYNNSYPSNYESVISLRSAGDISIASPSMYWRQLPGDYSDG